MQAIVAGVFAAPAYVMDNELLRGQDRRGFMPEALGLDDQITHEHGNSGMGMAS
jgi:2-hydroxychromene-2-carboxylate isomerase